MSSSESITCQELEATLFSARPQILASCYCGAEECTCVDATRLLEAQKAPREPVLPPRLNLQGGKSQGEYDEGGESQGEYNESASPHIPVVPGPPRQPQPPTPLNLLPGYNTPQEADNGAATPVLFAPEEDDTPILSPTLIPNQDLEGLD